MSDKILLGKGMHQSKGNKNLIITLTADARIGQPVKLDEGVQLGKIAEKPVFLGWAPPKKRRRDKKRRRSR